MKHQLEVDSVRKIFWHQQILSDVWLRCISGEILGLLGRNGSGKSTLLKILAGAMGADQAFIRIDGRVITQPSRLPEFFSYLPQHDWIPPQLSVRKALNLSLDGPSLKESLEHPFFEKLMETKVGSLSFGERRYLGIAIILYKPAPFVLLDEPFSGLSPIASEQIAQLIRNHSANKGIIVTDHSYRHVLDISDRILMMKSGRLYHLEDESQLESEGYLP